MFHLLLKTIGVLLILAVAPVGIAVYLWLLQKNGVALNPTTLEGAGVLGDSFGLLNALFSGLAFSGVIITILLQRRELQLQRMELHETRAEMERSTRAQHRAARLAALNTLLTEYNDQLDLMHEEIQPIVD